MSTSNVIRDGYERSGYIAKVDRLHEELSFLFRPMLAEQVETVEVELERKKGREGVRLIAAAVAGQLVSWSESDAEISIETVRRLPYPLLTKLYRIVAVMQPSEPDPKKIESDEEDEYRRRLNEQVSDDAGN